MPRMDERQKSQLSNLAQGLVLIGTPQKWSDLLEIVKERNGPFDPPLAKALSALKAKLPKKRGAKLSRRSLRATAAKLLKSSDEGAKQAGRAVSWALELRYVEKP